MSNVGGQGSQSFYISAITLLMEYQHFIESHTPLAQLNQVYPLWSSIKVYCEEVESYPELLKALQTLHSRSQIDFERALFCSWICLLIAHHQNLAEAHQRSLFMAGLLQDLGKHSIEDEVSNIISKVNGPYCSTLMSKQKLDNHPLIGSTFLERNISDNSIRELVLHHHAQYDGTGYPQHIGESQLDIDQQLLIIANEVSDQLDILGGHNHLSLCIPMLRINSHMFFNKAYSAWYELLSAHLELGALCEDNERSRNELLSKRIHLEKLLACLISLSGELLRYDFDIQVHGLRTLIHKLTNLFSDTGILNRSLLDLNGANASVVLNEIDMLFKGMPKVLDRCNQFVDELIMANKYELNRALLNDAKKLLETNISIMGPKKPSIFH